MASTDVEVQDTNKGVAVPVDDIEGLEDVEATDLTIPRITIDHEGGVFVDSQTNERFEEFDAIMLGLVKQRILWPPTPGAEGEGPMCRAVDFKTGNPDAAKWVTKHNGVNAVTASGFSFDEVEAGNLSCANCGLKEWDSHPNNGTPWCNEQFTFPIIRIMEDGSAAPALISFQRTGLKACKSYVSGFKQARRPLYTALTRISAVHQKKGTVEYVTPSFSKIGDSDPTEHPIYSQQLHQIRDFITTPRTFDDSSEGEATKEEAKAPAKAESDAEPQSVQRATPVDDDDEPF